MRRLRLAAILALCLFVTASAFGTAKMAVTSVAAETSTTTQDITISGFGTPVAAIVIMSRGVSDGTAAAHENLTIGFTDGTRFRTLDSNNEHNQADTDCTKSQPTNRVVSLQDEGEASSLAVATFTTWITDGVRITWSDVSGDGERLMVVFFGGSDMSAYAGTALLDVEDTGVDVTDPGFQPDVVLTLWTTDLSGDDHQISFGCGWDSGGGIVQRSWAQYEPNAAAKANPELMFSETYAGSDERLGADVDLSAFDASGFTATPRNAAASSSWLFYLALKNAGAEAWHLATYTNPTASGNDSETAPGFKPQAVLMGTSTAQAVDGVEADADAASIGVSAFDGTREISIVTTAEDNVATTNTQSKYAATAMDIILEDGSRDDIAYFASFDANGFTLTWDSGPADARKHWYLALQEEQADGGAAVFPFVNNDPLLGLVNGGLAR